MALKLPESKAAQKEMGKDYSSHLHTKPVVGTVSSSKSVAGQVIAEDASESKTLNVGVYTNGMSITVEGGRVINLGNYETARIGVSITIPCTSEALDDAYKFGTMWVSERIEEAVALAKG